jgi:calcineurin-like phosphoesterase family protein
MTNRYIADLHFGHENIIKFDNRPFANAKAMEKALISNWNSTIQEADTIYILGDFCWSKKDEWKRILRELKGNKILILGNHDLKNMSSELKRMFQDIKDYKEITDNGKHVIMSHYPILFYKNSYNPDCYMLCGHVHTTRENELLTKWRTEMRETRSSCGNIYNVGCMMPWMNYTPRTLDEIII